MRALGWGGIIAALTLLLATAATANAQPPKSKAMPDNWWSNLWGESKPKDDPKTKDVPKGLTMEEKAREMDRLLKAFQRREAVCEKLTMVGQETGNESLILEAERLWDLARDVYQRQSSALGLATVAGAARDVEVEEPYEGLPRPAREPNVGIVPSRLRNRGGLSEGISEPSRWGEDQR